MNEEEKKAIEYWKRDIQLYHYNTQLASEYYAQIILNLIEKQQKELNSLKEIEKSHQEENGKLRIELEQYKLLEANIDKANKIIAENKFDEGLYGLLMQEKEKNKEIAIKNHKIKEESNAYGEEIIRLDNELQRYKKYYENEKIIWNRSDYISKDKLKEKIEDYEKMIEGTFKDNTWYGQNRRDNCYEIIRNLNELLEEK